MNKFTWDGKHVHMQWGGGSTQEMNTACGLILSTWSGPNARGKSIEESVGYTFEQPWLVDCPACRAYMEANFRRCDGCGQPSVYDTCGPCVSKTVTDDK